MKRYQRPFDETGSDSPSLPGVRSWPIRRLSAGRSRTLVGGVVVEEPLEIRLNGQTMAVLMRTPGLEKELAAGFCLGEGLVPDLMHIALIRHCGRIGAGEREPPDGGVGSDPLDASRNQVDVTLLPGTPHQGPRQEVTRLIRSGCGRTDVSALAENLTPITSSVRVRVEILPRLLGQITRQQAAYRAAGGIHAAAVFDVRGKAIAVCEDIGRHNAVDKAVGYCLLRGIPLRDKILISTGRASYDMVAKGVRVGVPILASISSPTSLALELAHALNCTLLGYLKGKTVNIYTHGWRIAADDMP